MAGTWKNLMFDMGKQYDDDDVQIQVVGPGKYSSMAPHWQIEVFCKKPGCANNHCIGIAKKDTKLPEIVAKCKDNHKVCETKKEKPEKKKATKKKSLEAESSLASSKVGKKKKKVSKE
jgi:hypothetical protein